MLIGMSEQRFRQNTVINNNPRRENQSSQSSAVNFSGGGTSFIPDKYFNRLRNMSGFDQRAALGVCALIFQPIIDYCNPMADEKTRKFSVLKTIVKAVVGTTVGLVVRYSAMKYAQRMLKDPKKFVARIKDEKVASKMNEILADKKQKDTFLGSFGSVLGLLGVAITDFTVDMPIARQSIKIAADMFGLSEEKTEVKK